MTTYAAKDSEKLNDDQKRIIKTLPALEAVQKEVGEVKRTIEVNNVTVYHPSVFFFLKMNFF